MRWSPATLLPLASLALACGDEDPSGPTRSADEWLRHPMAGVTPAAVTSIVAVDQAGYVGQYTSLVSSSGGRQHIAYYDVTNGNLKYATCASNCTVAGNWTKGPIDQAGDVGLFGSLKVASGGRRDVVYFDQTNENLKYATCAPTATCTAASDWAKTGIDTEGYVGWGSALALGTDGSRHVSYFARTSAGGTINKLKYATCSSGCGQAANWTRVAIDGPPTSGIGYGGQITSIGIGPDGRRHISYLDAVNADLKYATCLSNCANAANWQKLVIDGGGAVGMFSSLAGGGDGVLHVSYHDLTNGNLKYARCAFDCTTAASWKKVTVRSVGNIGHHTSIAADGNGRAHLSFYSFSGSALYYLTCNANCTVASSWSGAVLDGVFGAAGSHGSLALGGGLVHISYYDQTNGNLKYLERTP